MKKNTFTFIVNFRGGTYCTQVQSKNVYASIPEWIRKIKQEKTQIKYLGEITIAELEIESKNIDEIPIALFGLDNIWFAHYTTRKGSFHINIVKTDSK